MANFSVFCKFFSSIAPQHPILGHSFSSMRTKDQLSHSHVESG